MPGNFLFHRLKLLVSCLETIGFALETGSFALETAGLSAKLQVLADETNLVQTATNGESPQKWRIDGESKSDSPSIIYQLISKVSPKRWRMANQITFFTHGGVELHINSQTYQKSPAAFALLIRMFYLCRTFI